MKTTSGTSPAPRPPDPRAEKRAQIRVEASGRLGALWPRMVQERWPALPAETAWRVLYSGLNHLYRRDPVLADLWISAVERLCDLEHEIGNHHPEPSLHGASVLSIARRPEAEVIRERDEVLRAFAVTDLRQGKRKHRADWAGHKALIDRMTEILETLAPFSPRLTYQRATPWWGHIGNYLWRQVIGRQTLLSRLQVNALAFRHRTPRRRAEYLVAEAGISPKSVKRHARATTHRT